jgi:hypothetical protein
MLFLPTQNAPHAVHPSLGVNSLDELIAKAKQQPGLNYVLGGGVGGQRATGMCAM